MKKLIVFILFVALLIPFSAKAEGRTYLLMGASNAINGNYAVANSFASRMTELTGVPVTVIVCAQNGSGLAYWQPGTALYNDCMSRVGVVSGVIFVNGEYEARYGAQWTQPFLNIVAGLQTDLGTVPMVFTRVNPRMPGLYVTRVWKDQTATPVPFISTDDLYLPRRSWHYLDAQLMTIGQRLADAMFAIGQ